MFESQAIKVASFPPCGDGLMALKQFHCGEFIASEKFDVCALNDGITLESHCSTCLVKSSKHECISCKMAHYCSETCQKKDAKLHELECTLASRLKSLGKVPMRAQRLLLRFLKSNREPEINFDAAAIDKTISEYLMMSCAIIKKYLPELEMEIHELLHKSCQLRCACFEIDGTGIGYSDSLKKINHSCDPNVLAEYSNDSVALFAIKEIQPREQLTISYVEDPKRDPNVLSNIYHFKCQCDYCKKK